MVCYCPNTVWVNFKRGYPRAVEDCKNSFSAKWPDSIGKEDTDWRSCNKNAPTTSQVGNESETGTATTGAAEGDDSATSAGEESSDDGSGGVQDSEEGENSEDVAGGGGAQEEDRSVNWEKVRMR